MARRSHLAMRPNGPEALPGPRWPEMTQATPLARFAPFGLLPQPARQQTTPTGISESLKGLSGANPRHCGSDTRVMGRGGP